VAESVPGARDRSNRYRRCSSVVRRSSRYGQLVVPSALWAV